MKIASWNVNSLNVRLPHLQQWLHEAQPDVVALQETKLEDAKFPDDETGRETGRERGEQPEGGSIGAGQGASVVFDGAATARRGERRVAVATCVVHE